MKPNMDGDTIGAIVFALAALFFVWRYLAADLQHSEIRPVWRRLNPLLNRLLPIKSVPACFGVGLLWGWLPCGLVYSASLYALGSGSAWQGGLMMLAFAFGTLPNLLAMGWFAGQLKSLLQNRRVRLFAGLTVCAWAVWQLVKAARLFALS